ncbi:hypothetical protein BN1263390088 [Stenotrophomonas maltophilia]|nr:hypothetical protein BN1263390088 [Stenotrophomonas maltophilia]
MLVCEKSKLMSQSFASIVVESSCKRHTSAPPLRTASRALSESPGGGAAFRHGYSAAQLANKDPGRLSPIRL